MFAVLRSCPLDVAIRPPRCRIDRRVERW